MNLTLLKKTSLLFFLTFLINNAVFSQDENNKWTVGVGLNIIDIRNSNSISGTFKDYFNGDDLNMSGAFVRIYAGRYLNKGFSLQFSLSANKIKKGYYYGLGDDPLSNDSFTGVDLKLKYDLNYLLGVTKWFDPFLLVGGGYAKIGDTSSFNVASGFGFNTWITDNFGLNFQSDYNHGIKSFGTDYFQHSAGLIFKLNNNPSFIWRDKN
ncbi:MAG: outer membrane beta-barrel protein [Lutibacter sp.]|nr:outer membrane beta-barrel protein [Lutibacter sp.]